QLKEEYMSKIAENPDNSSALRQEFYSKVEKRLEGCEGRPRLVNVSEAPPMMSDSCKQQMRELNQEITADTDAQVGDPVPKQYLDRYKRQIKNCMRGAVAGEVKERIESRIGRAAGDLIGGDAAPNRSLQEELERKEQRIAELEAQVERLQQQLEGRDAATPPPAGPAPDTQDRADRSGGRERGEPPERPEPPRQPERTDAGDSSNRSFEAQRGPSDQRPAPTGPNDTGTDGSAPAGARQDTEPQNQDRGPPGIVERITSIFG
ncbi:MAG: hypothetical protein ABEI97_05160, partial [Candidatus Nanohaloarchaea archaeon]